MLTTALAVYGYYQSSGRILPGVQINKTQLGGMTIQEAEITLVEKWNLEIQIMVTNGLQNQLVSPAKLGLRLDSGSTVQKAYEVGRVGSFLARSAQLFASLKDGMQIQPEVALDKDAARTGLEDLLPLLSQPAKDATIRVEGGILSPIPPEIGYTFDIEEGLALLEAHYQEILAKRTLQVTPKPVLPTVLDSTPALAEAQSLLDTPFTILGYDPITNETFNWPVPSEVLGTWLKVEADDQGLRVALDQSQVALYLTNISQTLGTERYLETERESSLLAEKFIEGVSSAKNSSTPGSISAAVTISHRAASYMVQSNDTMLKISWRVGMPMWMILEANPTVDPEAVQAGTELVIPSKDKLIPLPAIPNKRIVINLSQQRLWAYQDGKVLNKYIISTGIDRSPTQPGVFQVQSHDINAYASVWDLYMPHFLGIYEAWPGFMNGIHGLPTLSSGRRLWANILGKPASYGCVILDLGAAEWLYNWAEDGVVVEIQR